MLRRVIIACGLLRVAAGLWLGFRPFDDTYITFRYALNLASGFGFVYNIGEPVLGTTTPLWAMLLALAKIAHVPIETSALVLPLCLDVATGVLLCRLLIGLRYDSTVAVSAAVLFLAWFDYFSLARSGMEAPLFVFLAIAAIQALVSHRFIPGAIFCALAWLTRPEGALLAGLLLFALWQSRASMRRIDLVASAAAFCALCGGWALYAIHTFGSVIPQSVIAKASTAQQPDLIRFSWTNLALFFAQGQYGSDVFSRTYVQLMPVVTMLAGVAAGSIVLEIWRERTTAAVWRGVALLVFPVGYVGALALGHAFTYFAWYYAPIYPFAAALSAVGAAVVWRGKKKLVVGTCATLAVAQLAAAVLVKLPADRDFRVLGYFAVSEEVPRRAEVTVAAPEIGAVGWRVWPATVLDLEGLVTPSAVGRVPEEYVREKRPAYVILRTDNAREFLERAQRGGWFLDEYELTTARRDPYADREFRTYRRRR
jgi:hypothetical protein